jgi:hypothetical protein
MVRHCVDRVFVKDLKCEIGSPESHELSIHKTNFENWELELSANEEELHYFEEKQKKGTYRICNLYSIYESFNRKSNSEKY